MVYVITVIIAGGSGTRLWPLSTPDFPKHLLSLTGRHSLLQHTYERAKAIGERTYVITDQSHAHHVKIQLPELNNKSIIVEPGRKGTANCVLGALATIAKQHNPDETIAFLHSDHYIRDLAGFVHTFTVAKKVSASEKRIVLIGVEPYIPSTEFGYIKKDGLFDEKAFIFNVDSFTEKPELEVAQRYVDSGQYLWNCGYFVGSVNTFLKTMKQFSKELNDAYLELAKAKSVAQYTTKYLQLEETAIDYALMEKTKNLLVVPAAFDWMDLGSYSDLHKISPRDKNGNHTHGNNIETLGVENSYIRNHEEKPIAVIGLDNVAVVNTPKGLLVTRKDLSRQVGEVSKKLNQQRKDKI